MVTPKSKSISSKQKQTCSPGVSVSVTFSVIKIKSLEKLETRLLLSFVVLFISFSLLKIEKLLFGDETKNENLLKDTKIG